MAKRKKPAQGQGRTANSEPRMQVFKQFSGCNFELSPREFGLPKDVDQEQADLQMNYLVIQNNAKITSNSTIETRNNLVKMYEPPAGSSFTGPAIVVRGEIYAATNEQAIAYDNVADSNYGNRMSHKMTINVQNLQFNHNWSKFAYYDDSFIATTNEDVLWTGGINTHTISNAKHLNKPDAVGFMTPITDAGIWAEAKGDLFVSYEHTDNTPYRVTLRAAYVGKHGITEASDIGNSGLIRSIGYFNEPVENWHSGRYVQIGGRIPSTYTPGVDIKAVEFYASTDNSSSYLFVGRVDIGNNRDWIFNWYGVLDTTYMWPVSSLIAPTENTTDGPPCSQVTCIDSRLYFWGDVNKPYRLYIGGNPGNIYSTAIGTGGGFVDVEPGTSQAIRYVDKYKTQSGNSIVTMLCDSPNSTKEQRYNLVENTITLSNEQNMKAWQSEQVAGAVGCKSYRGGLVAEDGLYSVSRYGLALTTMTMEYNSQIMTNYVSEAVKPVFTDKNGTLLSNAILLHCDDTIYLALSKDDSKIDNLLFCYDPGAKAWWTYTLDLDTDILNLIHVDYEGAREGIGIVTADAIYLLPLTKDDGPEVPATFDTILQTGELSTMMPQQNWTYVSQLEFRWDYFIGNVTITLTGIDQFGRRVETKKHVSHDTAQYDLIEWMRVDLRLQSYQLRIEGQARYRLTHFISKVYTMSNKQGLVWGFDDRQTWRKNHSGDIHPTFRNYNDIKMAVIP